MRVVTQTYSSYDEAVRAVDALERAGVPHSEITLVSGDKTRANTGTGDDTSTGAGTGATIGTVLGGGAGLLAGLGALAIPGVGPVVAAGWLVATLTGAGVGAAAGGLLGSLTNAGIDEASARGYAEHVQAGGTLVSVRASDDMASQVESILHGGGAGYTPALGSSGASSTGLSVPLVLLGSTGSMGGTGSLGGTGTTGSTAHPISRPIDDALGTNISGERPDQSDGTPANPRGTMASRAVDDTLGTNVSGANPTRRT